MFIHYDLQYSEIGEKQLMLTKYITDKLLHTEMGHSMLSDSNFFPLSLSIFLKFHTLVG